MKVTKKLDQALYDLVKVYDDWIKDDEDDAELLSAVTEFCRIVKYEIPSTAASLERKGLD